MFDWVPQSLLGSVGLFLVCGVIIGILGTRLAGLADRLADRTGLGEALTGAVLLGASTSLPGLVTSVTAAAEGHPELAMSNAIGGIAVQTVFLAIADIVYRNANLEHAAASATNIMQGTLLVLLLALPLMANAGPKISWLGIHPVTPVMLCAYVYGLHQARRTRTAPMWRPHLTAETQRDVPDKRPTGETLHGLWWGFGWMALVAGTAGYFLTGAGIVLSEQTGLSETSVGGVFTAVTTSLPELVTAVAAVRRNALTLAVSNIIGGNAFDTLFVAVSDVAYRSGSIYHDISSRPVFLLSLTVLLTSVLLMGLVRREKRGIGNIGFESFFILLIYAGALLFLFLA